MGSVNNKDVEAAGINTRSSLFCRSYVGLISRQCYCLKAILAMICWPCGDLVRSTVF